MPRSECCLYQLTLIDQLMQRRTSRTWKYISIDINHWELCSSINIELLNQLTFYLLYWIIYKCYQLMYWYSILERGYFSWKHWICLPLLRSTKFNVNAKSSWHGYIWFTQYCMWHKSLVNNVSLTSRDVLDGFGYYLQPSFSPSL